MKFSAAAILFLSFACSAFTQEKLEIMGTSRDTAQLELREIASLWLHAYNGTDAMELAPMYAEDAQYVSSHVAGLVANGKDRLIANFQKGMSSGGHIDSIQVLSINASCDLATVLCKYDATNNGEKASGRNLLILKRTEGKWLIVLHMTVV